MQDNENFEDMRSIRGHNDGGQGYQEDDLRSMNPGDHEEMKEDGGRNNLRPGDRSFRGGALQDDVTEHSHN